MGVGWREGCGREGWRGKKEGRAGVGRTEGVREGEGWSGTDGGSKARVGWSGTDGGSKARVGWSGTDGGSKARGEMVNNSHTLLRITRLVLI